MCSENCCIFVCLLLCILISSREPQILKFQSLYLWLYWSKNHRINSKFFGYKSFFRESLGTETYLWKAHKMAVSKLHSLLVPFKKQSLIYLLNKFESFTRFWPAVCLWSGEVNCTYHLQYMQPMRVSQLYFNYVVFTTHLNFKSPIW